MSGSLWSVVIAHECRQDDSHQLSMTQNFWTVHIYRKFIDKKNSTASLTYLKVACSTENHAAWSFHGITTAYIFSRQWIQKRHGCCMICGKFYIGSSVTPTRRCCLQQFHRHWTICMQQHHQNWVKPIFTTLSKPEFIKRQKWYRFKICAALY